ncbi:MAG TPA: AbrB/MazE/SpoVT family DNA-binding domain-containing protein [Syntrophomonadaceae bacterium]|nr:AbrB/MazE/SpoVT family DNA-binding domain-containing protein [Syntrophomonadaceae bacterium]
MTKIANITIDEEYGQIMIPVEIGKRLNYKNFDWLKVNILSNRIVISLPKDEVDEELIKALVHEGVLIDPE